MSAEDFADLLSLADLAGLSEDDSEGLLAEDLVFSSKEKTFFFFSLVTHLAGDLTVPLLSTTPTTDTRPGSTMEELVSKITSEVSDLSDFPSNPAFPS